VFENQKQERKRQSEPGAVATGQRLNFQPLIKPKDSMIGGGPIGRSLPLPVLILALIASDKKEDEPRLTGLHDL
jgi:hypothetical protein